MNDKKGVVGARPDELFFLYCSHCERWFTSAMEFCPDHPTEILGWRKLSGRGTVYSYTVSHVAMSADVTADVPYKSLLIETIEGLRILAFEAADSDLRIGEDVSIILAEETESFIGGSAKRIAYALEGKE